MEFEGIGEVYVVVLIEELLIGRCMYRIEVLKRIHCYGMVPGLLLEEPFAARYYKREEVELHLAGIPRQEPMSASIWVKLRIDNTHNHATQDGALKEARSSLLEDAKSTRD